MSLDRWSDRLSENVENIFIFGEFLDVLQILFTQAWLLLVGKQTLDSSGNEHALEIPRHSSVDNSENSRDLDSVSWLELINKVIFEYNLHRPWKLSSWSILWHLLNGHDLGVLVHTVAVLGG